jgi:hypothetical protein
MMDKSGEGRTRDGVRHKINSFEIENFLECLHCHEKSVFYIYDSIKKIIRFYVNPDLEDEKVRYVFELSTYTREHFQPETYGIEMKCVSCGEWAIGYGSIPLDWEARKGLGRLESVYIPKSAIIANHHAGENKENEEDEG